MVIKDGVAELTREELLRYAKEVYRSGKSPEARGVGLAVLTFDRLLAAAGSREKALREASHGLWDNVQTMIAELSNRTAGKPFQYPLDGTLSAVQASLDMVRAALAAGKEAP